MTRDDLQERLKATLTMSDAEASRAVLGALAEYDRSNPISPEKLAKISRRFQEVLREIEEEK